MQGEKFTTTSMTISAILGLIKANDIAIPEIQRPFVWKSKQVRDLIDSLYKGFPVGYIILWKNPNVKLKDGNICISNYNKNGVHCEGIGCYISGEKGTIPHTYALRKLAKKIQNLYNSPDCPGKTVCVFSGPVNV